MRRQRLNRRGFTLIEVTIATALFTYMLAAFTVGYFQMLRTYRRNIAVRSAQQNARIVMEEIVRDSRTSYAVAVRDNVTSIPTPTGPLQFDEICLFRTGAAIKYAAFNNGGTSIDVKRSFFVPASPNFNTACQAQGPAVSSWETINASDARVLRLDGTLQGTPADEQSLTVNMRFGSAFDPALDINGLNCRAEQSTVCANVDLVSTVALRGVQ